MPAPKYPLVKQECGHPRARHVHGTRNAYLEDFCRCFPCRLANDRAVKGGAGWTDDGSSRPRCGVQRRLEALHAVGWSAQQLGDRLGITKDAVNALRTWPTPTVYQGTLQKVGELFDELWDQRPPADTRGRRISVSKTLNWAARQGFVTALAWNDDDLDNPAARPWTEPQKEPGVTHPDWPTAAERRADATPSDRYELDDVLVERIMHGSVKLPPFAKCPERVEAVRLLAGRGVNDAEIGRQIGMTTAGVFKIRHRNNIPPGRPAEENAA